jgi:cysteine-rich repeat protein
VSNQCATSHCGDGCVDSRIGETCEPPNTATCDASCHTIAAAVCGNSKREAGEQCDDGNTVNLDGCDSKCQFEQDQRANSVAIEYSTDAFCKANALGGAIASAAQSTLSGDLTTSVNSGATTIEFKFLGLTDLSGTSQASGLNVGVLSGTAAAAPAGVTYNGASDLDWWYATAASTIDPTSRTPLSITPATIAAKVLNATNASLSISISLAGTQATLAISGTSVRANIGAVSTPTASSGNTPGHLATENLDPTLQSFASMNNGLLCGNISTASLATVPIPTALLSGTTKCTNVTYAATNSLLDVLVTGCSTLFGAVPIINAGQPDQLTPAAPAGAKYKLTADPTTHVVTSCTNNGTPVTPLSTCLAGAAYSSYFGFTSDRVIAK